MPLSLDSVLDISLRAGLVDADAASRIRAGARPGAADPVRIVSLFARVPSSAILQAVAAEKGVEFAGKERLAVRQDLLERLPEILVRRKMAVPVREDRDGVVVAIADPEDIEDDGLKEKLGRALGKPVFLALADPGDLDLIVRKFLDEPSGISAREPADAVAFVNDTIREAFVRRASDIHIEAQEGGYRVRFRVDGELYVYRDGLPVPLALAVLSRIKVLARMDIAETRRPQDGSFIHEIEGHAGARFDIRVATAPTKHGERATLRLLGVDMQNLTLGDLGFSQDMRDRFLRLIRRPSGLILLTGPTGSGKTTTLYAAIREINAPGLNILTVEDPIEYSIPGVSQSEVDEAGKLTFASALRSLLRHDSHVLMVGEIRDRETADMALRAAITGHLVFSTLHTSTAVGAVTRLVDMGCEPYMVAAALDGVISQRLARRLCPACRIPRPISREELSFFSGVAEPDRVFDPGGCLRCQKTGFRGRIALFEMFLTDETTKEAIAGGANERRIAESAGFLATLREDASSKVAAGVTTMDEVRRVLVLEE
ncbi:MAG: GspE/PulE family protein [Planctomycetota bacterium]|nr:GspE/PulE family protein [Planctomycetota bacterium]